MSRALLIALIAVVIAGTGCDSIDAPIDPATGVPMLYPEGSSTAANAVSPALLRSDSCEELRSGMRAKLVSQMIAEVQQSFASAWHMHDHCLDLWDSPEALPMADAGVAAPTSPTKQSPAHSETNNQIAGVDEADIVKTDGDFIYLVSGGAFRILRSWPAAQTAEVAKVAIAGTPKKLFVHGNQALVYSALGAETSTGYYGSGSTECTYGYSCVPTGDGRPTKITIFDVSDRTSPKLLREITLSSSLLAARRIGSAVHTVVTTGSNTSSYGGYNYGYNYWPADLDVCDSSHRHLYDLFRKVLLDNLEAITLKTSLPQMEDVVQTPQGPQRYESPLADCRTYLRSSLGDGEQLTSVVSVALGSQSPASAVTVASQPGVVYAAEGSLYLAEPRQRTTGWGWYEGMDDDEATTLHKFALSNVKAEASYVASGLVRGRLLNQFSLDEHEGHLRVASTSGNVGYYSNAQNRLSVLAQQGQALVTVGQVEGIGPGEDIRSVRFDGDRGYVVTFKKTDPLFVLDLADPAKPRILGEAQIPGFSTYMQKLDATHLLTMGYDADDQGDFAWFAGVRLQIFDVSDALNPKLAVSHVIGTRGSSSEALTNHLAFTYYAPKNLLALPMTICEGGSGGSFGQMTFSGLMLFNVTTSQGFSERGRVTFPTGAGASCSNWWTDASSEVKRSLIIENYVYSLTDKLLKVNDLDQLQPDLLNLSLVD